MSAVPFTNMTVPGTTSCHTGPSRKTRERFEPYQNDLVDVIRRNRSYVDTDQDVVIVVGTAKVSDVPGGSGCVENHVLEHFDNGTYSNS